MRRNHWKCRSDYHHGNKSVNSPYSGHVTTLSDSSTVVHQSNHPCISCERWKKVVRYAASADLRTTQSAVADVSIFIVTDGRNNFNRRFLLLLQLFREYIRRTCASVSQYIFASLSDLFCFWLIFL